MKCLIILASRHFQLTEEGVNNMSADHRTSFQLANAVKAGSLPKEIEEMHCGPLFHSTRLTTAQRLVYVWTRNHGLTGEAFKVLETLVNFCISSYFTLYFDIKVKHHIVNAPCHGLTSLRILKTQPRKVKDIVTFNRRKEAWFTHSECLLLSLLSNNDTEDRKFGVNQILKLR